MELKSRIIQDGYSILRAPIDSDLTSEGLHRALNLLPEARKYRKKIILYVGHDSLEGVIEAVQGRTNIIIKLEPELKNNWAIEDVEGKTIVYTKEA